MTIEQNLLDYLDQHAIFPDTAREIMDSYKGLEYNDCMKGRWDEDAEGYPPQLIAGLKMSLGNHAYDWFGEHQPMAFQRTMFAPKG